MANEFIARNGLIAQKDSEIDGSLIQGISNIAPGLYSHAEGSTTQALGQSSHAEGASTIASGSYSHTEGANTISLGNYSHAEGRLTTSSGLYSHTEGDATQALGNYSHAEGRQTIASQSFSHTEGEFTITFGTGSHAEGRLTTASGNYSHAEGDRTIALGPWSHAEGQLTLTLGSYSHAEGRNTIASGSYQHVQGQFNIPSLITSAFIHGNGTSDVDRSNLIFAHDSVVEITGSLKVSGSITGSLFGTATTASYVLPLNQNVELTGSLLIEGGNPIQWGNGNAYIQSGMGFHISSEEGISIDTVDITDPQNPVYKNWYFNPNGTLTIPGGIIISASILDSAERISVEPTNRVLRNINQDITLDWETGELYGTASYALTASYVMGGGGATPTKLTSQTILSSSWVATGSYYTSSFTNSNITTTCDISITPQPSSYQTAYNAQVLPYIEVATGTGSLYSNFPPEANMIVDVVITQTT